MEEMKVNNIFTNGKNKNSTKGIVIPAESEIYKRLTKEKAAE